MTAHAIIHIALEIMVFICMAVAWTAVHAFHAATWLLHHPTGLAIAVGVLAVLILPFFLVDASYTPRSSYPRRGGYASRRDADDEAGRPEFASTTRHASESRDLDFDDYKESDPDWAYHGYRSGDRIDDQRSHDAWERCN